MRTSMAGVAVVFGVLVALPGFCFDEDGHSSTTGDALKAKGFGATATDIITVGNLKVDVYSEMPGAAAPFVRGPWPTEVAAYHSDNLFTRADVAKYWDNLEAVAKQGVARIADLVEHNNCSAAGCPGHAKDTDKCHAWNDAAAQLFHERKKLLLLLMGTMLHAVQDFYSHSNWVEQWDAAGKGGNIPTWDDARAAGDKQSTDIMDATHTGAWGAGNAPAGSQHHDGLNKDSAKSPEGGKLSSDGKTSLNDLAKKAAGKASEQWLDKFKGWIGNDDLWTKLQKCTGIGEQQAKDFHSELGELVELINSVESVPRNNDRVLDAYRTWQNRCATLSKRLFREILTGFVEDNPANKYMALAPVPVGRDAAAVGEVARDLREMQARLDETEGRAPKGAGRTSLVDASATIELALQALDGAEIMEAYRDASQVRNRLTAAAQELAKQGAPPSVVDAIRGEVTAVGQVVDRVAETPYDLQVLTPSRVAADDEATGLVVAETPTGPRLVDGELLVNGEVARVVGGKFPLPQIAAGATAVSLLLKQRGHVGAEHQLTPPIRVDPAAGAAQPTFSGATRVIHPRDPIVVATGSDLDRTTEPRLVDGEGNASPMLADAGSSLERIYVAPALPPGDYTLAATRPDGTVAECPTPVTVPKLSLEAPPIKTVGQSGRITVTSTADAPLEVTVHGGEPQIQVSPERRKVTVSKGSPGVVPFVAKQVGSYMVIARAASPGREGHEAAALSRAATKGLGLLLIRPTLETGDPPRQLASALATWLGPTTAAQRESLARFWSLQTLAGEAEDRAKTAEDEAGRERVAGDTSADQKERNAHKKAADAASRTAAEQRKRAGDTRAAAAAEAGKAGDHAAAAGEQEAAAEDYRRQSGDLKSGGKTGTSVNAPLDAAAKAEQRAAADHRAAATDHDAKAKAADKAGDKETAAGERDAARSELGKAADSLGRASSDLGAAGKKDESKDMAGKAADARKAAEGYGK